MKGYRKEDGWFVPADERDNLVRKRFRDAERIGEVAELCGHCSGLHTCVQAGGNWGRFPAELAEHFDAVYTFEPDPVSFGALVMNTLDIDWLYRFEAALGENLGPVGLQRHEGKSGRNYVEGDGDIPAIRIDDLVLPKCDLIWLDVEGFETPALRGAADTIERCNPVVVIEEVGHSARYGFPDPRKWLEKRGYRTAAQVNKDRVMVRA